MFPLTFSTLISIFLLASCMMRTSKPQRCLSKWTPWLQSISIAVSQLTNRHWLSMTPISSARSFRFWQSMGSSTIRACRHSWSNGARCLAWVSFRTLRSSLFLHRYKHFSFFLSAILEKYIGMLENKGKYNVCKTVFAGVNGKSIDDPDLQPFFTMKCWI